MKQIYFGIILFSLLWVLAGCKKNQSDIIYDGSYIDEIKLTRQDFTNYIKRNYILGGSVTIAKDNKLIYSEGFGLASKDLVVPMTRKNKLRIGDVSQLFTSIIYLRLVEEGILEPDSTVQYYIKDYPVTEFPLAIKHLPYHTSGIRKEEPGEDEIGGLNPSIQKGLEIFMNDELTGPPGWFEEMSMFNTNLLGAVMENATKKKFSVLLKEYVTDTLHLNNTVVDDPIVTIEGRSDFYDINFLGQVINAPCNDLRYNAPSTGILSNAENLVKLGMAILESDYFSDEFREEIFKSCDLYGNYKSKMANGWVLTIDEQGRDVNASSGSVSGGGAAIVIYPEEKLIIAYAVNMTLGNDMLPVVDIVNYFLDDPKTNDE